MEGPTKKLRTAADDSSTALGGLVAWLASKPGGQDLGRIAVGASAFGGNSLFATEAIPAGATIAIISRDATVTPALVAASAEGLALGGFPHYFKVCVWLANARRDPGHPFQPYVATLPAAAPNAPWWPVRCRAWLAGTNLGFAVDRARAELEAHFSRATSLGGGGGGGDGGGGGGGGCAW